MEKSITGKEARYILHQARINLRDLSDRLGISPQSLNSRLNANEFRLSYMMEINKVMEREVFAVDTNTLNFTGRQPVLDIRVAQAVGIPLESDENKIIEQVSIPMLTGCIGVAVYGDGMSPKYRAGDVIFVRPASLDAIEYGRAYIIVTVNDRLVKNIYQGGDGMLRLSSTNAERNGHGTPIYPDYDMRIDSVLYLYKVVACLHREQV